MQLVTAYPGVRHRIVHDAAQAAEHVQMLTRALAHQPYKFQVRSRNSTAVAAGLCGMLSQPSVENTLCSQPTLHQFA